MLDILIGILIIPATLFTGVVTFQIVRWTLTEITDSLSVDKSKIEKMKSLADIEMLTKIKMMETILASNDITRKRIRRQVGEKKWRELMSGGSDGVYSPRRRRSWFRRFL